MHCLLLPVSDHFMMPTWKMGDSKKNTLNQNLQSGKVSYDFTTTLDLKEYKIDHFWFKKRSSQYNV